MIVWPLDCDATSLSNVSSKVKHFAPLLVVWAFLALAKGRPVSETNSMVVLSFVLERRNDSLLMKRLEEMSTSSPVMNMQILSTLGFDDDCSEKLIAFTCGGALSLSRMCCSLTMFEPVDGIKMQFW